MCDCATKVDALSAEVARLNTELASARRAAVTDPLTGLPNRAGFAAHRTQLVDVPHTVLLIDVDGFKQVNDRYGHEVGDLVLQVIADRMAAVSKDGRTVLARLGGDEFAATIVGDAATGRDVADRIGRSMHRPITVTSGATVWPSVSIGVVRHTPGHHPSVTLRAADKAMYATKRAGRVPTGLVPVELPTAPLTTTGSIR